MRIWNIAVCLTIGVASISCSRNAAHGGDRLNELDGFLDSVAIAYAVPGYAFAAFDDERVLHHRVFGYKNVDTREPVDSATVFEAASISKPIFSYLVLVMGSNVLPLDSTIGATGPVRRELGHDARSLVLTPRMLLTHQGGLPNWRSRLNFSATAYDELFAATDTLHFADGPGDSYGYSGEGYVLLQEVLENVTGQDLNALAHEFIFDPLEMTRTSFFYDDAMRMNAAVGHTQDGRPDKWEIGMPLASSTLHSTASDLARFGVRVVSGIKQREEIAVMADSAVTVGSRGEWHGSWGHGLGIVSNGSDRYVFHGGNNVIFMADFIYGFSENLGYVLLTNSARGGEMIEQVERRVYGKDIPR